MKSYHLFCATLAAASAIFSSCDEDDASFGISALNYVVQQADSTGVSRFMPFVAISSASSADPVASAQVFNSALTIPVSRANESTLATPADDPDAWFDSPASFAGDYEVLAYSKSGAYVLSSLSFAASNADTIAPVVLSAFSFADDTISISLPPVEGADGYGLGVILYDDGQSPSRADMIYNFDPASESDGDTLVFKFLFRPLYMTSAYASIRFFAVNEASVYREATSQLVIPAP